MISVIETEEKLRQAARSWRGYAGVMEEMLLDGLIVISDVQIVRLIHAAPEVISAKLSAS
jgi:hypothetical protein